MKDVVASVIELIIILIGFATYSKVKRDQDALLKHSATAFALLFLIGIAFTIIQIASDVKIISYAPVYTPLDILSMAAMCFFISYFIPDTFITKNDKSK